MFKATMIGALGVGTLLGCGGSSEQGDGTTLGGSEGTTSSETDAAEATVNDTGNDGATDSSGQGTSDAHATDGETQDGCAPAMAPAVGGAETRYGAVQGAVVDGVTAFMGIPYAAPPVQALRWQPPEPPECWEDVRPATTAGSLCPQLASAAGPVVGDEDCLYLNVWTPQASVDAARPVMVFIHGGGHVVGSGSDPFYSGAHLAREYDVVVVTINYRLGVLGYLAHDGLDGLDPRGVSGNYGLLDQIHALRWVSDNVDEFGGDPNRVTVFGESAGAASTCAVLGSPEAQGLLNGAIVQSGGCTQRTSTQYREQVGNPWVEASACAGEADLAACLRALPAAEIVASEPTGYPSVSGLGQDWSAYVDGVTLPASTLDQMSAGQHVDVPLIVGANAEETARDVPQLDQAAYETLVNLTFAGLSTVVLAQYPASDYPTPTDAWIALTSDIKFVCSARRSAAAASSGGRSQVYRYHFSYDGYVTGPGGEPSAFHGLELVYAFGNLDALSVGGVPYPTNTDDETMRSLLGEQWTTFARTGDPSTATLSWPPYDAATDPYAGLDAPPFEGQGVRTDQCDFWDALLGAR